jgi:hypothetical protein
METNPNALTADWKQITEADDPESEIRTGRGVVRYIVWLQREKSRWLESGNLADIVCGDDGRCALYAKHGHGNWKFYGGLE